MEESGKVDRSCPWTPVPGETEKNRFMYPAVSAKRILASWSTKEGCPLPSRFGTEAGTRGILNMPGQGQGKATTWLGFPLCVRDGCRRGGAPLGQSQRCVGPAPRWGGLFLAHRGATAWGKTRPAHARSADPALQPANGKAFMTDGKTYSTYCRREARFFFFFFFFILHLLLCHFLLFSKLSTSRIWTCAG